LSTKVLREVLSAVGHMLPERIKGSNPWSLWWWWWSRFLVTLPWNILVGCPRWNASGIYFQLLPGPISRSFPLLQFPPVFFSSSSFAVFIFYVVLGQFVSWFIQ
jgi:hypothetical protein